VVAAGVFEAGAVLAGVLDAGVVLAGVFDAGVLLFPHAANASSIAKQSTMLITFFICFSFFNPLSRDKSGSTKLMQLL